MRNIKAIQLWEMLKDLQDVQPFLGFVNFYCKFLKNLSGVARPIIDLTCNKGLDFHWRPLEEIMFEQVKDAFTAMPILMHFDPALEAIIERYASNYVIGCIRFQKHVGQLHPITYHSRKMKMVQKNYDIHDKDLCQW
jgi:hypothetical protein